MAPRTDHTEPSAGELAELSALADGTLDPSRQAAVAAWIAGSPELTALYERERKVVAALHQARAADRASAQLRARIEAGRPRRAARARWRIGYVGVAAAALAAVVLALVLALPSGAPGGPSASDAAALATRGPTQPAPAPDPNNPRFRLDETVGAIHFPNWMWDFGLRAVGKRVDQLGGRRSVTVYYDWPDQRVAYTIVGGSLRQPAGKNATVNGTPMRIFALGGRPAIAWHESGDTCILLVVSGPAVSSSGLEKLAVSEVPAAR
jgi:hypothetical protein